MYVDLLKLNPQAFVARPCSLPPIVAGGAGAGAGRGRLPGLPGRLSRSLPPALPALREHPAPHPPAAVPPCPGPAPALGGAWLTAAARGLSPWIQRGEPSSPAASCSRPLGKGSSDGEIHQCPFHSCISAWM
ncbi:Krueppel-like factor 16 [Passer domesticus]|uniref:Krueppel-like factor 16 n=1 Tax=Passer domesticus TaxID=48849 RepID=UPI0030FEDDFA